MSESGVFLILLGCVLALAMMVLTKEEGFSEKKKENLRQKIKKSEEELARVMRENAELRIKLSEAMKLLNRIKETALAEQERLSEMDRALNKIDALCKASSNGEDKDPGNPAP